MNGKIIFMDTINGNDEKDGSNWKNAVKSWEATFNLLEGGSNETEKVRYSLAL